MVKNILVLAETLDLESSSAGKASNAMISALIESGFLVKVYHYSHKEVQFLNTSTILIKERKRDPFYYLSRFQRVYQRITRTNVSERLEHYFGFSFTFINDVNSMVAILKNENPTSYDLVITLSKGASYRTHAALLKLPQWHNKWLAYIHDPYPFHWYPSPYEWKEAGFKQKECFFIEVAHKSRWLGYPSQKLGEWMGQFNELFLKKAVLLPHQMPSEKIQKTPLESSFQIDKFTILHAGNLLAQRDPFPLLEAWNNFLKEVPEAVDSSQLFLIGSASYHQPKLSKICELISSVHLSAEYVSYARALSLEASASANIILEAVSDISPFLPAKFPSLVMANRPLLHLGPRNSESRRLLGVDYKFSVEADDILGITCLLKKCYTEWKHSPDKFCLNRPDLESYFSSSHLADVISYICENPLE